ncbi:hypothetical protein [Actinomadura decatromicini]|uniref:Uncharacterized protein n=1 Tax=Actinomadura decatromicini TaxID=2604572 RepID=A0A5D3FX00_9ACTN|nr:hypothetical protein [Actinomadura decatromicini]TYK52529.1 hypothetical protein FXF68_01780 [Actinomadura decatromicini]
MTEVPIDQIEFRWHPLDDLTGIATSLRSGPEFDRWNGLLRQYAGVSGRGNAAAAQAQSSAVYLTYRDGMAALLLRSRDPNALPLYDGDVRHGAGAGRLDLVARALIAPERLLTAERAMRIMVSDPDALFDPMPGQTRRGQLPQLTWPRMEGGVRPGEKVEPQAREHARDLAPVLAAVLANPGRPVTVVLPADDIRQMMWRSRALALLWASRLLLHPLLRGERGHALHDWRPTFSTCEAPQSSSDGRDDIWLAFRERGPDGPPIGDGPRVVHLDQPLRGQGSLEAAANRLAEIYAADGDQCLQLVANAVRGHRTLEDKIDAIVCSHEIAAALSPHHHSRPPVGNTRGRAARRTPAEHVPAAEPATVGDAVPAVAAAQASGPPPAAPPKPAQQQRRSAPRPGDKHLSHLYKRLAQTRDRRGVLRTVNWIAARTAAGARLDAAEVPGVLDGLERRGWFAAELRPLAAGPERMADLLQPVFAASGHDERLELQLKTWHVGGPPPVVADALAVLAARLEPDRAYWLADHCLRHEVPRNRSGAPAVLVTLLRWPGTKWPVAVGALAWLAPVLLVIVGLLALA